MKNICNIVKKRANVHNMQSASALSSVKKKKKKSAKRVVLEN